MNGCVAYSKNLSRFLHGKAPARQLAAICTVAFNIGRTSAHRGSCSPNATDQQKLKTSVSCPNSWPLRASSFLVFQSNIQFRTNAPQIAKVNSAAEILEDRLLQFITGWEY